MKITVKSYVLRRQFAAVHEGVWNLSSLIMIYANNETSRTMPALIVCRLKSRISFTRAMGEAQWMCRNILKLLVCNIVLVLLFRLDVCTYDTCIACYSKYPIRKLHQNFAYRIMSLSTNCYFQYKHNFESKCHQTYSTFLQIPILRNNLKQSHILPLFASWSSLRLFRYAWTFHVTA